MSTWDCLPREALWYGEIIVGKGDRRTGTETDYHGGFSAMSDDVPDVTLLCPEGWEILETTLKLTRKGKEMIPDFIEDQIIPES